MDPADPNSVNQALAAQGALLGQHAQDLRGIKDTLEALSSNVVGISQRLEQGFPPQPSPLPAAGPSALPPPLREPHLPTPERYAGDVGVCGRFLLQCALIFELQPLMYQADSTKVAYITSLLTGRAAQWALVTWEGNPRLCASYQLFVKEMRGVFDHPVRGKEAGNRLLSLRQGSRSVAEHAIEFSTLATESGWDEPALMGVFLGSLNESLKDGLAVREESKSLAELIDLARRLDNRIRERHRERHRSRFTSSSIRLNYPSHPKGLGSPRQGGTQVGRSQVCNVSIPPRTQLSAVLLCNHTEVPIKPFVDSGADENFMAADFVELHNIPVFPLTVPLNVNALDGRLLSVITHQTVPLCLLISGNHHELISFFIMPAPHTPVVLGLPWLRLHNPHVDWTRSTITSWSVACHSNCLRSAVPPLSSSVTPPASPDLFGVPTCYHDLAEVFSKQRALSLPPHRPYDCGIDLLPGSPLPSSRLYNLSRPERETMERYIQESLAAGVIRPSSSPVGAGFFFVSKKDKSLRPCIDYRGLNAITVKNKYPLPLLDSAFHSLHQCTVFTKLDLRNAYHLVRIREGDEWKTAFNTPLGHFEYLVMPFGLTNAPAIFQSLVNDVLRDMLNRFVFVYLDDILIFFPQSRGTLPTCQVSPSKTAGEPTLCESRKMRISCSICLVFRLYH